MDLVLTDSTSFTRSKTYPADTALYWRVRAEAENGQTDEVALTWSASGHVRQGPAEVGLDHGQPHERRLPADGQVVDGAGRGLL